MRTAKTLIRLGGCPGWSESLLGAHAVLLVLSWGGSFELLLAPGHLSNLCFVITLACDGQACGSCINAIYRGVSFLVLWKCLSIPPKKTYLLGPVNIHIYHKYHLTSLWYERVGPLIVVYTMCSHWSVVLSVPQVAWNWTFDLLRCDSHFCSVAYSWKKNWYLIAQDIPLAHRQHQQTEYGPTINCKNQYHPQCGMMMIWVFR